MFWSIAVLLAIGKQTPLVAFAARFYAQSFHQRSYQQIYLSDLHGKNRRQLTFDRSDKSDVRWVGKGKLAWLQTVPAQKNLGSLVEYDLAKGATRVVSTGFIYADEDWHETTQYSRGQAVYVQVPKPTICEPPSTDPSAKILAVTNGCLKAVPQLPKPANPWSGTCDGAELFKGAGLNVGYRDLDGTQETLQERSGGTCGGNAFELSYGGSWHTFRIPGPDLIWRSKTSADTCWVRTAAFASSAGSDIWIYALNLRTGEAKLIADDVLDVDFEADQPYWAASSNNKGTAQIGNHRVWARDLWVGDARTGRQWRIAQGAVYGESARIQPE
ncbi:MAG TPA: hypothetical protein VGL56_17500 [Fimbriimonadaceae bacterium]|jgi:hypothetical protein